jgi:nucleotide-binding universal stress UspA family protein
MLRYEYRRAEFLIMLRKRKVVSLNLVLIPVDGSIRSEKSIEFASSILDQSSIKVIVFHVMRPGGNIDEANTFVNRSKDTLEKSGFKNIKTEIAESLSDPSEEILNMISRENIDFVIISAYGHGKSEESSEIGSVTMTVVNLAKCPIIVVK